MFFWAALEKNIPFLLNFAFTVMIARLVTPETYGLVAMTAILTALAQVLQNLGFAAALVQRKELTDSHSTTTFIVNTTIGGALAVLLALSAGGIAAFFGHDEIVTVVRVNALVLFLAALGIVQMAMLQRSYRFKTGLVIETIAILVAGSVALVTALRGFDLWALMLLILVREAVRTMLLWALIRWRPSGGFSMVSLRELWAFGRHMIGASLYHQVATNLSSLLLGKFYSPATLGLFSRAQSLQLLPVSLMTQPLQRVAFPLYSRNQSDRGEVLRLLRMHSRVVALLAGLVTASLAVAAGEIVLILVGDTWAEAIPMLRILALAAFFNITFPLHSEANKAIGESRWFFWVEVTKKTVLVTLVIVGVMQGVTWLLWSLVLASIMDYVLSALSSRRFLVYRWQAQIADLGPALVLIILSVGLVWIIEVGTGIGLETAGIPLGGLFLALGMKIGLVLLVFGLAIALAGRKHFPEIHGFLGRLVSRVMRQSTRN